MAGVVYVGDLDTLSVLDRTGDLIEDLELNRGSSHILTPYPGTRQCDRLRSLRNSYTTASGSCTTLHTEYSGPGTCRPGIAKRIPLLHKQIPFSALNRAMESSSGHLHFGENLHCIPGIRRSPRLCTPTGQIAE